MRTINMYKKTKLEKSIDWFFIIYFSVKIPIIITLLLIENF